MKVVYFVTDSGRKPVEEFIKDLNVHSRDKFFTVVELLENFGRGLAWPHAKYIGAVLTNGFPKKSNKAPKHEKTTAIERRKTYLQTHQGGKP